MKKTLKALLSIMLVLVLITGCGKKNDKPSGAAGDDEEFTLTVWVHPFVDAAKRSEMDKVYDKMVEDYKEKYPKANIVFEEIPWANREQKITTTLAAGEGPDIFYLIPDQLTQFAEDGVITPIDEIVKDLKKDEFSQASLDAVSYKGKLYGLPMLRTRATYVQSKNRR